MLFFLSLIFFLDSSLAYYSYAKLRALKAATAATEPVPDVVTISPVARVKVIPARHFATYKGRL